MFVGKAFGSEAETTGEVVFNTGLPGTRRFSPTVLLRTNRHHDLPADCNYGISRDDFESIRPFVHGFVIRELEEVPSNCGPSTTGQPAEGYGIPGITASTPGC